MTAMRLKRDPSPSGGIALGKMGVGATMLRPILPAGARWVEYLESTGTQWIDTGLKYSTTMDFNIVMQSDISHGYEKYAFGYGLYNTANHVSSQIYSTRLSMSIKINTYWEKNFPFTMGRKFVFAKEGNRIFISTSSSYTYDGEVIDTNKNLYLFATNRPGYDAYGCSSIKLYSFDMGPLRLRPIAIGTTGYMLDLVSGEYLPYGNKGTGDFVIGPDAPPPTI